MKKSFIVLSLVLVGLALVSANGIIVSIGGIESPLNGAYVEDEVLISWVNGGFQDAMLKYNSGDCNVVEGFTLDSNVDSTDSYEWYLYGLEDGIYCIKIVLGDTTFYNLTVVKDTTAPVVEFIGAPYFGNTTDVISITFNISDVSDILMWRIDFGDGSAGEINYSDGVFVRNYNYDVEGIYTVTIVAEDEAENEIEVSTVVYISDEVFDWEIALLSEGMNMFSIPLMSEDSDIEEVLGEEISDRAEKVWSYQQGEWKYNVPSGSGWSSSSSRLQEIVPGYGYIIFMNEDSVLHGKGKAYGADVPPEVVLSTGWNLIGHYGFKNLNISDALSSLDGSYNHVNSVFRVDNDGALNKVKKLRAERAYWLNIKGIELDDDDDMKFFRYSPSQSAY